MRISSINKKYILILFIPFLVVSFHLLPIYHHHSPKIANERTTTPSSINNLKTVGKSCQLCLAFNLNKTYIVDKINIQHLLFRQSILFRITKYDISESTICGHPGRAPPATHPVRTIS